jgi:uracil-DNA glycosylase
MPSCQHPSDYPPPPIPGSPTLDALHDAAQSCRACDLYEGATQAVIGEGPPRARVVMVGEQPGDREDIDGHPFVGPAGRVLDDGLALAGIARDDVYITNVVKHFRYRSRGKRRIHQRPDRWQVKACLPWLQAELSLVRPEVIVLLGVVAAQALLGGSVRVGDLRGSRVESDLAELVTVTVHPASILRVAERSERRQAMDAFVADLSNVAAWLARS